jgi:hypothetical protein
VNRSSLLASVAERARWAKQSSKKRAQCELFCPSATCDTTSVRYARLPAVLLAGMASWLAVTALPARELYLVVAADIALAVAVRAGVRKPTTASNRP